MAIRTETRHTIVLLLGTCVTTALSLAFGIYATRTLGAGAVGAFTHALSLAAFLQIAFGPINGTVARFSAEYASAGATGRIRSLVSAVSYRVARYGFVALIVALIAAVPLSRFFKYASPAPLMIALAMTYVTLLLSVARGALRGMQRFGALNANTIFEAGCRLAMGVGLLLVWVDPSVALLAYFVALVGAWALSERQLARSWGEVVREPVDGRAVKQFALPMFVFMLVSAGFQNVDMLMVKRVLSAADADSYGVSFYLTGRAMAVLLTPFTLLLLPLLTGLHGRGQPMRRPFLRVCGYFLMIATIPLVLFALWPDPLMRLLYGDRFADAAGLLFPLALVRLLGSLCHILGLARAAAARFGFLYIYVLGLVFETTALCIWNSTPETIIKVIIASQAMTLVVMIVHSLVARAHRTIS